MDALTLSQIVSQKVKLIRTEMSLSQQEFANRLGISKKTMIEIEKKRIMPSWIMVIAICTICNDSQILKNELGEEPVQMVRLIANDMVESPTESKPTLFWDVFLKEDKYTIYKNIISEHYKLVDSHQKRLFSSFSEKKIVDKLTELKGENNENIE